MTKKYNKGSGNQNSPQSGQNQTTYLSDRGSGDNSKGTKRNKDQNDKTDH